MSGRCGVLWNDRFGVRPSFVRQVSLVASLGAVMVLLSCGDSSRSGSRQPGTVQVLSVSALAVEVVQGQAGIPVEVRVRNGTTETLLVSAIDLDFTDGAGSDRDADYNISSDPGNPPSLSADGEALFLFLVDVSPAASLTPIKVDADMTGSLDPSGDPVSGLAAESPHGWTVVAPAALSLGSPQTTETFVAAGEAGVPLTVRLSNPGGVPLALLALDLTLESRGGRDLSSDITWQLLATPPSTLLPGQSVDAQFEVSFSAGMAAEAVTVTAVAFGQDLVLGSSLQASSPGQGSLWGVVTTILPPSSMDNSFAHPAVGDIDGDQTPDLVVGSSGSPVGAIQRAGVVYVYFGYFGPSGDPPQVLAQPNPASWNSFGEEVVVADFDGDGLDDVAVGADSTNVGTATNAGEIVVFFGPDLVNFQVVQDQTPTTFAHFGERLVAADFDGDGLSDLGCGARVSTDAVSGEAFVFYGPDFGTSTRLAPASLPLDAWFGIELAAGDLDGDGLADLAVGAPGGGGILGAGDVRLFWGPSLAMGPVLTSPTPLMNARFAAPGIGDVTGDGVPDVVVGARGDTWSGVPESGRAYLFEGPGLNPGVGLATPSPEGQSQFGSEVKIGDVNGDGIGDAVLPAVGADVLGVAEAGAVQVLLGPSLDVVVTLRLPMPGPGDTLGADPYLYDVNGDGVVEVLVGAVGDPLQGRYPSGAVLVFAVP